MPTIDELHAADKEHAEAIAAIKARLTGHETMLARHDSHLIKLDETTAVIRESMARTATKDDIAALRSDVTQNYVAQLKSAHDSIPKNFAMAISVGGFILAVAAFALQHWK